MKLWTALVHKSRTSSLHGTHTHTEQIFWPGWRISVKFWGEYNFYIKQNKFNFHVNQSASSFRNNETREIMRQGRKDKNCTINTMLMQSYNRLGWLHWKQRTLSEKVQMHSSSPVASSCCHLLHRRAPFKSLIKTWSPPLRNTHEQSNAWAGYKQCIQCVHTKQKGLSQGVVCCQVYSLKGNLTSCIFFFFLMSCLKHFTVHFSCRNLKRFFFFLNINELLKLHFWWWI